MPTSPLPSGNTPSGRRNKVAKNPPPRKKACQNCTTSKVRCGLEKPTCSRCASQGRVCEYPAGNRASEGSARSTRQNHTSPSSFSVSINRTKTPANPLETTHLPNPSTPTPTIPPSQPQPGPITNQPPPAPAPPPDAGPNLDIPDLSSPDDIDGIRDRWMRPYLTAPPERPEIPKVYNPFTLQYIASVLRTYPRRMLKDGGVPPIIHPMQVSGAMPRSLANCYSLVRMWDQAVPGSEEMVVDVVRKEMDRLVTTENSTDPELVAAFQAYLIYAIMMYFSPIGGYTVINEASIINLMELAYRMTRKGLICPEERSRTRPPWESWITVSAKRRAVFTMYLFTNVFNAEQGLQNYLSTELTGNLLPEGREVWEARDRETWEKEYDYHLSVWGKDGMIEISELWRSKETGTPERRKRVDRWVQTVDEFGMMLFAVCVHIHGC
ncbi:hypothetical protein MW887_008020 [Aspergillus wentii]|nr:hypothetical protein MW887_008020 [Aspergillus wentii]